MDALDDILRSLHLETSLVSRTAATSPWGLRIDEGPVALIRERGQDVRERLGQLSRIGAGGRTIRTHGDYHLGQTMLSGRPSTPAWYE